MLIPSITTVATDPGGADATAGPDDGLIVIW